MALNDYMGMGLATVILLVFYLYLLVRWQHVKRPVCYCVGVAALLLGLFGRFFGIGQHRGVMAVAQAFDAIAALVAFGSAVVACYSGRLPISVPGAPQEPTQQ